MPDCCLPMSRSILRLLRGLWRASGTAPLAFVSRQKRQCASRGAPPPQSAMWSREAWSPRAVSGASTVLRSTPERSLRPPRGPRWGMTATTVSDYVNGNFLTGQQLPSAQQRACRWARVRVLVCVHVRWLHARVRQSARPACLVRGARPSQ